jgi:hypothetical protein
MSSKNFCQSQSPRLGWGHKGSHLVLDTISLDESLLDTLDYIINPWEMQMFNPLTVGRNLFTVEVTKQDGSLGKITGKLFADNFTGSDNEVLAYTLGLLEKDLVPVYTDKGWRSFYQTKVVSFKFGKDN